MRTFTILFSAMVLSTTGMQAQTVATFEDLTLHHVDTFYANYSALSTDVGFNDGLAYFPCVYDSSFGDTLLSGGFAYSNMTDSESTADWADSITIDPRTQYTAKAGSGYGGSAKYAVVFCNNPVTFAPTTTLKLTGAAVGHPVSGFYITNTSYAYSSMKFGDLFDTAFHSGDWFLLTIKGYHGGALTTDSVNFYLADYRFTDTTMNYIVKTWQWVNLLPLGHVDSLQFSLSSSNMTGGFLDVPTYFCIDNFTTNETDEAVQQVAPLYVAKVYPNPAKNILYVGIADKAVTQVVIRDMAGSVVSAYAVGQMNMAINTSSLAAGTYVVQMVGDGKVASVKFVKE